MIFTFFQYAKDDSAQVIDKPWEEWAVLLTKCDIRNKKDGPGFVPGEMIQGQNRYGTNVKNIQALVADFDKVGGDKILECLNLLQEKELEFVFYTTFRHTPDKPRARIVLPMASPISPTEFKSAWQGLSYLFKNRIDQQAKDINRFYYFHTAPAEGMGEAFRHKGRMATLHDLPMVMTADIEVPKSHASPKTIVKEVESLVRSTKDPVRKEQWNWVLKGEPFAQPGERHDIALHLTMILSARLPKIFAEDIATVFKPSLSKMTEPTYDQVINMLRDGQDKVAQQRADKQQEQNQRITAKIKLARGDGAGTQYTQEELDKIADMQGCEIDDLRQRLICYIGGAYYFLTIHGYVGPFSKDGPAIADTYLAPFGIRVTTTRNNRATLLSMGEILRVYGVPVKAVVADLTLQHSVLEMETQTLREATAAPRKSLSPVYSEEVHTWLQLLGGPLHEKLLDWIAVAPQLDKTCCGLYVSGQTGSGKSLLAQGLSKLWGDGNPTEIDEVFSDFNETVARVPLIFADEYIPKKYGKNATGEIRKLVGTTNMNIRRKHKPTAALHGSVRLIIASNEEQMLEFTEAIGRAGQEALAKRLFHVHANPKSVSYLHSLGLPRIAKFLDREIAEHALWLQENREVKPGTRFYVEGDLGSMLKMLNVGNDNTSVICEWIVGYLTNPGRYDQTNLGYVLIQDGKLYVNNKAIRDHWEIYLKDEKPLSTKVIGTSLAALSDSNRAVFRVNPRTGRTLRYWAIDEENLIEWAERYNASDRISIQQVLSGKAQQKAG